MSNSPKNKKIFFFSIFLIPSLLCLGFYYFAIRKPLSQGRRNIFIKLPHYGPAQANANGKDSVFYTLPEFSFHNHLKKEYSTNALKNKIYIIAVVNASSKEADQLAAQLYRVQDKLNYLKKDFQIITVLKNTGIDTLKVLSDFSEKVHTDARIWNLVAGPDQELLNIFEQNTIFSNHPISFEKSAELLLIDRKNQIRGHYPGGNLKEVNRLIDEVVVLAAEYGKIKNM